MNNDTQIQTYREPAIVLEVQPKPLYGIIPPKPVHQCKLPYIGIFRFRRKLLKYESLYRCVECRKVYKAINDDFFGLKWSITYIDNWIEAGGAE